MIDNAYKQELLIDKLEEAVKDRAKSTKSKWLQSYRENSLLRFHRLGVPTTKDEEWKYTNIKPLTQHKFHVTTDGSLHKKEQDAWNRYVEGDHVRITFVNGIYNKELSEINKVEGIEVLTLKEALKDYQEDFESWIGKYSLDKDNTFVALNNALMDDGCFIKIDEKKVLKEAIHIIHVTSASNGDALVLPRSVILAGPSSEATILESHVSFDDSITYFANALTDIFIQENANIHYCKAQKESLKSYHIGNTRVWQEQNSNLNGFSFMSGAAIVRNNLDIILDGEGSNATLNGLYSIFGKMHTDNHTSVDHRFPNCTSNQLYKGILNESSRAVFNGKIFVQSLAQQTNSYQLNKNLLLGEKCRVDTKPQLEIFADDVKCTHGATIGQLEEDEMFYLRTRGVSEKEATKMLSKGFVDDIIDTVDNENINKKLHILLEPSFERL